MTDRRSLLLGLVSVVAIVAATKASATYTPLTLPQLNALDYNILGNGAANDAAAIQTFLTSTSTAGAAAFFPGGKTYILGSSSLTVPDGLTVICGLNATFTRSADPASPNTAYGAYTGAMVSLGSHCKWSGGVLNNTVVTGTSASSNSIGTGAKSFTTQAGLPFAAGHFLRIYSRANGANHMEGTVTSYSGTSLVMNITFSAGSGTLTDWNINYGGIYQAPMVLHGVTESIVENVRVTGNWYVGLMMDGWNPSGGGSLEVNFCTFRNCYLEAVQNRGLYLYGRCNDNVIDGCFVNGSTGTTDYGHNQNPANASGTANSQSRNKTHGTTVNGAAFQGFELGDLCFYNLIENCTAQGLTDTSGVGFLIQEANTQLPQYNKISDCLAHGCVGKGFMIIGALYGGASDCSAVVCGTGYYIGPSGSNQAQYIACNSCEAISNTIGFRVLGNSSRCDLNDVKAIANTTNGVQIDSGAVRTLVTGRAFVNTTNNLLDNGTSSVTTGLTVV